MSSEPREALEAEIRRLSEAEDWAAATTSAIRGYGPEILGYLAAMVSSESDASDVFAMWSENVWKGIRGFRWESSFRTWAYTVARHALSRLSVDRRHRIVPLDDTPELMQLADHVRTSTLVHLRTAAKDELAKVREQLHPDDRTLLILRIDRRMPWTEIARVMAGDDTPEDKLKPFAATLRKRFERAKERLRKLITSARPS